MKLWTSIKIAGILATGLAVSVLGGLAEPWAGDGGESISGSIDMAVLIVCLSLTAAVLAKSRHRDTVAADSLREEGLAFAPKPGLALLVVFRDDKMAKLIGADVTVDGRLHSQLISPRFTLIDVAPGAHRVAVEIQGRRAEYEHQASPGDVVVLHMKMRMTLASSMPTLESVTPDTARRRIGAAPMTVAVVG
jgi:hypothetical protein